MAISNVCTYFLRLYLLEQLPTKNIEQYPTNEMIIDIVKIMGIDIRFIRTPFITKESKFLSTRCLFFVAYHHISTNNKLVIITIKL